MGETAVRRRDGDAGTAGLTVRRRSGVEAEMLPAECGFTLVELMIVMAIIAVLATIAIPSYIGQMKHAREAVLREDLHVIRAGIDAYTMDKEKAPQSLDDLVQTGYLRAIPRDPMTGNSSSWVTTTDDSLMSVDQTEPGINDVHSGSQEVGSDGQPYSAW
ncbi:MAG TPA: prepilin-type N-terminal cleavage/methylation domain-containing protein [Acidisarcina sp.]